MDGENENGTQTTQQAEGDDAQKKGAQPAGSDPKPGEGSEGGQGGSEGDDGRGGKPGETVNRHKYEREMAAKDKEIEDLKAQMAEMSATKEGREKLEKRISELEAQNKDDRVTFQLQLAGCKNVKAAKALLDDYDGDIDKMKAACDYLFADPKKTGSTGGKPEGTASDLDEKLDRAFGFKKKKS